MYWGIVEILGIEGLSVLQDRLGLLEPPALLACLEMRDITALKVIGVPRVIREVKRLRDRPEIGVRSALWAPRAIEDSRAREGRWIRKLRQKDRLVILVPKDPLVLLVPSGLKDLRDTQDNPAHLLLRAIKARLEIPEIKEVVGIRAVQVIRALEDTPDRRGIKDLRGYLRDNLKKRRHVHV